MTNSNILEIFLKKNINVIYSIKSLSQQLNVKKRHIYYLYEKSDNIIKVNPFEVGCGKKKLNIFKYNTNTV